MSIQTAPLFLVDGKPSPVLVAQSRAKGSLQALQASVPAADPKDGTATASFRAWWNAAFPTRNPLPDDPVTNPDGTGSAAFWKVFA